MHPGFKIKNLSKQYSTAQIFHNLCLDIGGDRITGLTGASGCGKSTLARILLRMERYNNGAIYYGDTLLENLDLHYFRKKNQMVFQDPYLSVNPCFTMEKILVEPLRINKQRKKEIGEKIAWVLDLMEIKSELLNKYPMEVSGGELQRMVLGRALILGPEFLILDETFSCLDDIMAKRLMIDLKKIGEDLNMGILFISHQLQRVHFFSDRVVNLNDIK